MERSSHVWPNCRANLWHPLIRSGCNGITFSFSFLIGIFHLVLGIPSSSLACVTFHVVLLSTQWILSCQWKRFPPIRCTLGSSIFRNDHFHILFQNLCSWEIGVAMTDGHFEQVSYVNSIATTNGVRLILLFSFLNVLSRKHFQYYCEGHAFRMGVLVPESIVLLVRSVGGFCFFCEVSVPIFNRFVYEGVVRWSVALFLNLH